VVVEVPQPDYMFSICILLALSELLRLCSACTLLGLHVSFKKMQGAIMLTWIIDIIYVYLAEVSCKFNCHDIGRMYRDGVPFVFGDFLVY
jgi:hypothetical protein